MYKCIDALLIEFFRSEGIEVIIGEQHAPWGKLVARALDLPYVTMCPMRTWDEGECLEQIVSEMVSQQTCNPSGSQILE